MVPERPAPEDCPRSAFVFGTGRCGSTLLSSMLRRHRDVLSLSEFWSALGGPALLGAAELSGAHLWALIGKPHPDVSAVLRVTRIPEVLANVEPGSEDGVSAPSLVTFPHLSEAPVELEAEVRAFLCDRPRGPASAHFTACFEFLCTRYQRGVWVERSGGSIEYADDLLTHWPEATAIHLVRDGRECAISMAGHPLFRLRVARLLRGRDIAPSVALSAYIPLDRFGAYWSALMARTAKVVSSNPERSLVLRYEDLRSNPEHALRKVAGLLGVRTGTPEWDSSVRDLVRPSRATRAGLSPSEATALERACRTGMRWLDKLEQRAA